MRDDFFHYNGFWRWRQENYFSKNIIKITRRLDAFFILCYTILQVENMRVRYISFRDSERVDIRNSTDVFSLRKSPERIDVSEMERMSYWMYFK